MVKLVNLTPHAIVLRAKDGTDTLVPPSGIVARAVQLPSKRIPDCEGIPVPIYQTGGYGCIEGLPEKTYIDPGDGGEMVWDGNIYIVSSLIMSLLPYPREDVVAPGTGPDDGGIRNEKGQIVAVTRLIAPTGSYPFGTPKDASLYQK